MKSNKMMFFFVLGYDQTEIIICNILQIHCCLARQQYSYRLAFYFSDWPVLETTQLFNCCSTFTIKGKVREERNMVNLKQSH